MDSARNRRAADGTSRRARSRARQGGRLLVFALLAWGTASAARTLAETWRAQDRPRRNILPASRWLPGTVQVMALQATLAEASRRVPPGEALAFQPSTGEAGPALFEALWASYLLPERDVVLADLPPGTARFLVSFHSAVTDPRYRLVARSRDGALWVRR
jgi:hypothetical protein